MYTFFSLNQVIHIASTLFDALTNIINNHFRLFPNVRGSFHTKGKKKKQEQQNANISEQIRSKGEIFCKFSLKWDEKGKKKYDKWVTCDVTIDTDYIWKSKVTWKARRIYTDNRSTGCSLKNNYLKTLITSEKLC